MLQASSPVLADLPTVEPPSSGGGSGLMGQIKGYLQDGLVIGGLVVAAIAFLNVATSALHTFVEVRNERASWTKFGAIIVVGVVLLVAILWLLGKSASIII
ncbi:TIGR03745 family integrating conjugative element membrane protein [Rouxiella badensis]|uniref:TIGR03745 family integrating conjugative element membrane protein n=1 Tax=Rouxiella badensis TaxID=1646377 RepID=UPI001D13916F|nr:TIGR03745 family integrating conjugative element membrane protein [Rouxiella badensis]